MLLLSALATTTTLATQGAPPPPPCPGATMPEAERCFAERLAGAEADLARYVTAAHARLARSAQDDPGARAAVPAFEAAERAWSAYRDAECGAVYDYWSSGTVRGAKNLACRIRLTRLHAHTVWAEWLTYVDSTPPILPEPAVPPDR